ncbi:MAG: efflux RND transporter periplasmic adaptor subunit [Phycisphaerae bacterium]|nr:efflux RND transporter periplasmic adaptor subunit [Phycisphaerae bacterium]
MLIKNRIIGTLLLGAVMSLAAVSLTGCRRKTGSEHDGHAHAEKGKEKPGHEGHDHSNSVTVTQEQAKRLGIKISRATRGSVSRVIRAPGEIKVNSDRMAHVAPRAAGVVREVLKILGDSVKSGETLAWIESDKLAEAKLDFYAKETEVGCCEIRLPRAQAIFENVAKLTAILAKEPDESEIRKLDKLEMGKYRGLFLTSYSAYLAARTNHKRESELHAKKISSGRELLAAETAMTQARTKFNAIVDTARFETLVAYTEAAQERQVAAFNAVAAEKRLRLKGADDKVVAALRALVPKTAGLKPCTCDDPNCKDGQLPSVADTLGKDGRFNLYALQAPFGGTVIAKHIVVGESIDETVEVFTVANLSSIWVDLAISQDNISLVQAGQNVTIGLPDGSKPEAKIEFISPIIAAESRTAMARVILPNPTGKLRPGTFVDAGIVVPSQAEGVVVPKSAIQLVHDHPCVFVWGHGDFELREIVPGVTDGNQVEILRGLKVGEAVASAGAFHLKAEYAKSRAGDTGGGHGHPH